MLKFFLYLFLLLLFLVILAGTGYWSLIVQGWPWWVFAVIAGSAAGVVFGIFAIKKFLVRRNEKKFVQRVIKEEEATAQQAPEEEKYKLKEMQTQWKLTIDKLQKSHLRRKGNPLYVLPWYMVIGEERTGKTSAIKNSNLSSPLTDVSQAATISGTKNCDWWFFDQAIILDTAGRYTIPVDESPDKKEWQTFLTLLSKYRKKEPLNGVIVAVASDTLLNENDVSLSEKGRNIRQRINQLMRILGARFPVYLLVTKMDLVNGFTDFCDHIPEQRENQVMGYSNKEKNPDCMQVLENCMTTVFSNLKKLRTIFIQNRVNHFAVSFPTEFLRLKPGLASYVRSLFGEDIYQATPLFRGIYFSSACRQGTPESQFLKTTGIKYSSEDSKEGNKGYFLKNFFQAVLPGDRNIFTPLTEFIMWRKTTISLGFFSLMLVCIAFCGILTFSYHNNVKALNSYNNTLFNNNPLASGKTDNILMLDRQRFEIDQLEYSNDNWILPRLGLNHSLVLEERLKQRYLKNVRENLIKPLDTIFFDAVDRINSNTFYTDIVDYAVYAVRRINVLKSSFNNESLSGEDQFGKSVGILFPKIDKTIPSAIASKFSPVYYDYLKWDDNENNRVLKLNEFQNQLSKIADKSGSFHWLVSRAVCRANDITLADFFKGYDVNQKQFSLRVNGAYTKAGRDEIHEFVEIIGKAFQSEEEFIQMENRFWAWYAIEFYRTWYAFAVGFPKGKDWKSVTENWLDAGTLMATEHNPYFML
ncbi:MAG: type VI secretion protein IcmF/TssM N-terminal domain-containing protein, partial [Thermodesulfobacteriota bacterium]|nr:type VI secretion protein IcmF/TssM N-terminal domain-containing protein [Thermodesulfobacteriota bacterium]